MLLSLEQRKDVETLIKEIESLKSKADSRQKVYYDGRIRGLKARMDENPQTRYIEWLDKGILAYLDSPVEKKRLDATGYNDGFKFDEPGAIIGPEYLDFRYVVIPASGEEYDLGYVFMDRKPGWRRDCLFIDYPQPDNSQIVGPSLGHFRFRQVPGPQFLGDEPKHPIGVFPFEGRGINYVDIKSPTVEEAVTLFFSRFQVPKPRYSIT